MKWILITIASAGIIGLGFISKNKSGSKQSKMTVVKAVTGSYTPVAVLELFTSEGCSSCPPADNLLPQLAKLDANVITLSFHVDYWNRLGWTDPFSSSDYSDRQREYSRQLNLESIYTPQLIVNGEYEFTGGVLQSDENTKYGLGPPTFWNAIRGPRCSIISSAPAPSPRSFGSAGACHIARRSGTPISRR